jgi:hypothetical protein
MYERLLYVSKASEGVGMREAYDIIRVSHNRNSTAGLTGGLMFIDGYFIQVLEGSPFALDERYNKIKQDLRHTEVTLRYRQTATGLLFPDDWMAIRDGASVGKFVLASFGYQPGFPEDRFDGELLLTFIRSCFGKFREQQHLAAHSAA